MEIHGVGASFPAPLYQQWLKDHARSHPGVHITYVASGSGKGREAILNGTADFGASDAAMTEEEMAQVKHGVILLPMTAGSIALAYHLPGVTELRLSREVYTGIFLGRVVRWDDPRIASANPQAHLPAQPIQLMVRGDSSGTSFALSTHLAAISEPFATQVGIASKPRWPTGRSCTSVDTLVEQIRNTPGAIGFLELGQALKAGFPVASLENRQGQFVRPTTASAQAALRSIDLFEDLIGWIKDPAPADAYPIVTFTWIICYRVYDDPRKAEALRGLLSYGLEEGQKHAEKLGYVPLPDKVVRRVKTVINQIEAANPAPVD